MRTTPVVYHQSTFEPWPLEDGSVQAILTSPPYWGLRRFDILDVVIGGRPDCQHDFVKTPNPKGNGDGKSARRDNEAGVQRGGSQPGLCACGAWKGQYGHEPTYQLYVEHTLLWMHEARRVLREDGVFFLNLGDSYGGSWGAYSMGGTNTGTTGITRTGYYGRERDFPVAAHAPSKCKLLIPHRVAIGMIDAGWTCRNDIPWVKGNAIPESVRDRFSKRFEMVFLFTRSEKYYFDLDAVRQPHQPNTIKRLQRGSKASGNPKGKNPGDVWHINAQASPFKHYAMWPEALVERMVRCSSRPGDLVLDPFCGSGRTLDVADRFGRRAAGIDLGYAEIQAEVFRNSQGVML